MEIRDCYLDKGRLLVNSESYVSMQVEYIHIMKFTMSHLTPRYLGRSIKNFK